MKGTLSFKTKVLKVPSFKFKCNIEVHGFFFFLLFYLLIPSCSNDSGGCGTEEAMVGFVMFSTPGVLSEEATVEEVPCAGIVGWMLCFTGCGGPAISTKNENA